MNLFQLPDELPDEELVELLLSQPRLFVERLISAGQVTPQGVWYDQTQDELVVLLQGEAELAWDNGRRMELKAGDWLFIPAREKHRVEHTSSDPPAIWLAIHGNFS